MEVKYYKGNPAFPFEDGRSNIAFVWEMKLKKGESVTPNAHAEGAEFYIILEGIGEMSVGEESNTVLEGDVVHIPRGQPHTISNTTDQVLHVVGFLMLEQELRFEQPVESLGGMCDENLFADGDSGSALTSIRRLLNFADEVRSKIEEMAGSEREKSEQISSLERAILAAIGRIWQNFKGQ